MTSILQISALARRIARSSPQDAREQQEILERLTEIRNALDPSTQIDVIRYLDGAVLLTMYLAQLGSIGGYEVIDIVSRLMASIEKTLNLQTMARHTLESAQPRAAAQAPAGESTLAQPLTAERAPTLETMGKDMLLGEIMIRLGMITPEQLQEGARTQRAAGLRFGEALIERGFVTWSQVETALRFQDRFRKANGIEVQRVKEVGKRAAEHVEQ
jgi:hypothetical protein